METDKSLEAQYTIAVQTIKTAILQSQYQAVKLVNKEQLALYYGIGLKILVKGIGAQEPLHLSAIDYKGNYLDFGAFRNVI